MHPETAPVNDPQINRAMNLWWTESIYAFYSAELDYTNSSSLSRHATAEIGKLCSGFEKNTQQFSESTDQPSQKLTMKRH